MFRKFILIPILLSALNTSAQSYYISTLAGVNSPGYSGDGGPATSAMIYSPLRARPDAAGNVLIADSYNNVIRNVSGSGIITTIAGNGTVIKSGDGGLADTAGIESPISVSPAGNRSYYIAEFGYDSIGSSIRFVNDSGIITTIAGGTGEGYTGDGGPASAAQFVYVTDIALDRYGRLFIADGGNNTVRLIDTSGIISTFAGIATAGYSGDGGAATAAQLSYPTGIAIDSSGNVFIADEGNNLVRKVDTTGTITTFAGTGTITCSGDGGPATAANLTVQGLEADKHGNLFIADWENARVRKIDSVGIIHTVAGNGMTGSTGDGGPATAAQMLQPFGVALDTAGNVYIADYEADVIRKLYAAPPPSLAVAQVVPEHLGGLRIWPDPSNGIFEVDVPVFPAPAGDLVVLNSLGQVIATFRALPGSPVSVALNLSPGTYVARLTYGMNSQAISFSVR